jgi:hypothetical protein
VPEVVTLKTVNMAAELEGLSYALVNQVWRSEDASDTDVA